MAAIEAIIFDLGNCVIGFDHRIAVNKILRFSDKPENQIYDFFFDCELTQNFERGMLTSREFFEQVSSSLSLRISYLEFLPIWNEIFFPMVGVDDFIRSLPSGLKLIMLSNINQLHYTYLRENFARTLALFDRVIPSYITGFIKPEPGIYDLAIKATGKSLESILYIDDRIDLILKARDYGLNSIQFQGLDKLREEFINLGIWRRPANV